MTGPSPHRRPPRIGEAPAFRRDALVARGYVWRGDIIAQGADLAERDFLSGAAARAK